MLAKKFRARSILLAGTGLLLCMGMASAAQAADAAIQKELKDIQAQLHAQDARLAAQERRLKDQQDAIAQQTAVIGAQHDQIVHLTTASAPPRQAASAPVPVPATLTTGQAAQPYLAQFRPFLAQADAPKSDAGGPSGPVGQAPTKDEMPPQVVESLPEGLAVLTPAGHFILTPSLEYTTTTNDRLVYRGVVIVPGINLGEVEASTDARNIASAVADLRFGITNRLEVEARVPVIWSDDRATVLSQGPNSSATQSLYLQDAGIGDIEVGARYQVNNGQDDWPIFVANGRIKTDTGMGPFDVSRDAAGIAQQVALGSGFNSLEGGFSVLKATDPAVLFGSVNYIYSIPKNINQTIGNVLVGRVDPSSSINATLGFGFAVNPDFSFSLGYEHSYVLPQTTMLGTTRQETTSLQVGALTLGMALRLSPDVSLNGNFEFGVTSDAPDMRAVFSLPTSF